MNIEIIWWARRTRVWKDGSERGIEVEFDFDEDY